MKKTIRIPAQIRLQMEFFEGYGMEELTKTIIVLILSGVIAFFIYKITHKTVLSTFFVIGSTIIAVVVLTKNRSGFSMLDNLKNIIKYELMQRDYKYERGDFNKK